MQSLLTQAEIHKMVRSNDANLRKRAAELIGKNIGSLENKDQAQKDLIRLTNDKKGFVREKAVDALGPAIRYFPNKTQAWLNLHKLTQDTDRNVRMRAAYALGPVFLHIPDKLQAWKDIIRLTQDSNENIRIGAAYSLGPAFPYIPDKVQAWKDLHELTQCNDRFMRWRAAYALGQAFPHIPDKLQAWQDLHRLTQDKYSDVRSASAGALGPAFPYIPDKQQAWQDLHRLTHDEDSDVRAGAACALGLTFPHIPSKLQAWQDLLQLTQDEYSDVRCKSYHSSGRASIFRATEATDKEFKAHLNDAIKFFQLASMGAVICNPAAFCLPFYKSLYSLLFTEVSSEEEVQRYLAEAKEAVETSESRDVLLKAVDNLSKALQKVRAYTIEDIVSQRRDLKAYTRYCLQTAECLSEVREEAPSACRLIDAIIVEKSIPIIDDKIKALFREVEAAAKRFCKESKGTELEELGKSAYDGTRGLSEISSPIVADRYFLEIVPLLKAHCNRLPKGAQDYLKPLIEYQDTATQEQRFETLKLVLLSSLVQGESDNQPKQTMTNIAGNVYGHVLPGAFSGQVNTSSVEGERKNT